MFLNILKIENLIWKILIRWSFINSKNKEFRYFFILKKPNKMTETSLCGVWSPVCRGSAETGRHREPPSHRGDPIRRLAGADADRGELVGCSSRPRLFFGGRSLPAVLRWSAAGCAEGLLGSNAGICNSCVLWLIIYDLFSGWTRNQLEWEWREVQKQDVREESLRWDLKVHPNSDFRAKTLFNYRWKNNIFVTLEMYKCQSLLLIVVLAHPK